MSCSVTATSVSFCLFWSLYPVLVGFKAVNPFHASFKFVHLASIKAGHYLSLVMNFSQPVSKQDIRVQNQLASFETGLVVNWALTYLQSAMITRVLIKGCRGHSPPSLKSTSLPHLRVSCTQMGGFAPPNPYTHFAPHGNSWNTVYSHDLLALFLPFLAITCNGLATSLFSCKVSYELLLVGNHMGYDQLDLSLKYRNWGKFCS